ncbi:MAG: lysophospholipid acyltransferase family protein [Smithellaceae bacterium]|nr:lysophospholipid acyltransferase family protein [Smithellaceae bacterium]
MIKRLSAIMIKYGLSSFLYYFVRAYFWTITFQYINEGEVLSHLRRGGKVITAVWHQRIFAAIGYVLRFKQYRPSVMISKSRDGNLIADVYRRLYFRPVRGSSSKGGKEALRALIDDLADHPLAVHVLDGPRGPAGVIKPGLVTLAQKTRVPIFPIYFSMSNAWVLKSWDRFLIPKPFSTITVRWDRPITVPSRLSPEAFEEVRALIETRMLANQRDEDAAIGKYNLI